jgi:hypothetical protein
MRSKVNLSKYENKLLNCSLKKSESIYQKVADNYEDDLLDFDDYPKEYFDFFLRLLSEHQFYSKPGLWNFLLIISTESHKLSGEAYKAISGCIIDNYSKYEDEDLCLAVCDFIARNYEYIEAEKLLLKLKKLEQNKTEKGFADDGLRILNSEQA